MSYHVRLEISGPTAMWTRPDTGDAPVSYPALHIGSGESNEFATQFAPECELSAP
jgi:CRISPR-associated protein Cas5d